MSQDDAARASDVPIDNLRRYEAGKSGVPGDVLRKLAVIYGHKMDDFYMEKPPKADLANRPMFHLSALPGMEVDAKAYEMLLEQVNRVNAETRAKRSKKPTGKQGG